MLGVVPGVNTNNIENIDQGGNNFDIPSGDSATSGLGNNATNAPQTINDLLAREDIASNQIGTYLTDFNFDLGNGQFLETTGLNVQDWAGEFQGFDNTIKLNGFFSNTGNAELDSILWNNQPTYLLDQPLLSSFDLSSVLGMVSGFLPGNIGQFVNIATEVLPMLMSIDLDSLFGGLFTGLFDSGLSDIVWNNPIRRTRWYRFAVSDLYKKRFKLMFYYIYKTTNTTTSKYYYGKRHTKILPENDSYLGSGKILKRSVKKYR